MSEPDNHTAWVDRGGGTWVRVDEPHVLVGRDWWGCLCGTVQGPTPRTVVAIHAGAHISGCGARTAGVVEYRWADVKDVGPSPADLHQWLWEQEAF